VSPAASESRTLPAVSLRTAGPRRWERIPAAFSLLARHLKLANLQVMAPRPLKDGPVSANESAKRVHGLLALSRGSRSRSAREAPVGAISSAFKPAFKRDATAATIARATGFRNGSVWGSGIPTRERDHADAARDDSPPKRWFTAVHTGGGALRGQHPAAHRHVSRQPRPRI
jgi:hypothetical protein